MGAGAGLKAPIGPLKHVRGSGRDIRRGLDAGELQMAGEPSRFAALGGYGAAGCAADTSVAIALPGLGPWPAGFDPRVRVVSLDGSASIGGHGDVNRVETFWAALNLLK